MKRYHYRLGTLIFFLFFSIFIPVTLVAFYASQSNYRHAHNQIVNMKKVNLNFFVNQYDNYLGTVKQSILSTLNDETSGFIALKKDVLDTQYMMAKYALKQRLAENLTMYPFLYGFYVRIEDEKDVMLVSAKNSSIDEVYGKEAFKKSILEGNGYSAPEFLEYQEKKYLVYGLKNTYMEIGYLICLADLVGLYFGEEQTDEWIQFEIADQGEEQEMTPEMDSCYVFENSFSSVDVVMHLYVLKEDIITQISLSDRMGIQTSVIILIILPLVFWGFRIFFLNPLKNLSNAMENIMAGDRAYRIQKFSGSREFCKIEQTFNETLDYNEKLKNETYELALEKEKQQLMNLKLQINPHLLLNSLSTIHSLAQNRKIEEIQSFTMNLSKYFRYALRDTAEFVTLRSEMEFISSYIKIQKIRYPERFYVMFDVEEELMEVKIPPLMIENFVENSTKYALKPDTEIEILVIVRESGGYLSISICDNGKGMDSELLEKIRNEEVIHDSRGKHIGIWNCIRRLKTFYGEEVRFAITSEPDSGTQVWIEIPKFL